MTRGWSEFIKTTDRVVAGECCQFDIFCNGTPEPSNERNLLGTCLSADLILIIICEGWKWREGKWPESWIKSKVNTLMKKWNLKSIWWKLRVRLLSAVKQANKSLKERWCQSLRKFTKTSSILYWASIKVWQYVRNVDYEVRGFLSSWEVVVLSSIQTGLSRRCGQGETFHYSALLYAQKITLCVTHNRKLNLR